LFLVAAAPAMPTVLLPVLLLVVQVATGSLLLPAVLLMMASSLLYLVRGGLFVRPVNRDEEFRRLWWAQATSQTLFLLGVGLLVAWGMAQRVEIPDFPFLSEEVADLLADYDGKTILGFRESTSLLRPWDWSLLRWLVVEPLGRSLFTTVLIADLFVRIHLF